jgi:tetratricopeptide (TPR) repeat protein
VKHRALVGVAVLTAAVVAADAALARNPHCAGGIQYVVQGLRDKDKGNTEDYLRQMGKAIEQLTMCSEQDPADLEAMGYLGWALAEVDSAGPAGAAFARAIAGLEAKGDKKKTEIVSNNRESYWAKAFNDGIKAINDAQSAYEDYSRTPADDGEKALKEEATRKYGAALLSLTRANQLKPGHTATIRNIATAYALQGDFDRAESALVAGTKEVQGDSAVKQVQETLRSVRANKAGQLLDAKKYDEAIAYYGELAKAEPTNADHFRGLGSALTSRAQTVQGDARAADWKASAEAYAKAVGFDAKDPDLQYMAAQAYAKAGDHATAEKHWREAVALKPSDLDAVRELSISLGELKKYAEGVQVLGAAIDKNPEEKTLYQAMGTLYNKAGDNAKTTQLYMVFLAMQRGTAMPGPAAAGEAKAGSAAANTKSSLGDPDKAWKWETDGQKLVTWAYFSKRQAFTFEQASMGLIQKSDWTPSAPAAKK